MTKAKNSVEASAQSAGPSHDAAAASWEAKRSLFNKTPIPGLASGLFVKSTLNGHGGPYEVLKVDGEQFVACRKNKVGGKPSLKAYVFANDASYFVICEQSA